MTRSAILRRAGAGFSLVELSIVTLIIGIFLTLGLSAMNAVRENTALSATNAKQAALKEALIGYLRRNSRLPCPDSDFAAPDGMENRTPAGVTNPCTQAFGLLPYVTLGIARDAAQDGWGNLFSYHVSNTAGANTDWTLTASFRTGNTGVITVNDRTSDAAAPTPLSTTVVAVIVSHGPNGFGAYTIGGTRNALAAVGTDERDNSDGNTTYYRRSPTTDDTSWPTKGAFDDIALFITADDLLNPLFKEGSLKPPATIISEAFAKIKQALIGYAMVTASTQGGASCTAGASSPKCRLLPRADNTGDGLADGGVLNGNVPWSTLGLAVADATDPYLGTIYTYVVNTNVSTPGDGFSSTWPAGAATVAVTLTATNGTTSSILVGEFRGYFIAGSTFP